jgi:small subunit ribosomal protein S12
MVTMIQLTRKRSQRIPKHRRTKFLAFKGSPFRQGICTKFRIVKPKKPNSAQRKVVRLRLTSRRFITAYIPGIGHNLQKYNHVLVRAGRVRDLPGIKYKLIRSKLDFKGLERFERQNRRSKYGIKSNK